MKAIELMEKQCQEYFDLVIKKSLVLHDDTFIAQCFDDIHHEVMREIHDVNYSDHIGSGDEIDQDFNDTCETREYFTRSSIEFLTARLDAHCRT